MSAPGTKPPKEHLVSLSEERKFAVFLVVDEVLTTQYIGQMVASRDAKRVVIECLLVRSDKIP